MPVSLSPIQLSLRTIARSKKDPPVEMDVEVVAEAKAKAAPSPDVEQAVDWKAPAAMVFLQLSNTGMVLLSKVAIGGGMFVFALLTYRSLFGAAIILPLALFWERCVT